MKLGEDITMNGEKEGLAPDHIQEIQNEIRGKLVERLQRFDQEYLGKIEPSGHSTQTTVGQADQPH